MEDDADIHEQAQDPDAIKQSRDRLDAKRKRKENMTGFDDLQ
jgi:hypothetical protein